MKPAIGVLALQGDFQRHADVLSQLDVEPVLLKTPERLQEVEGLIIPGGESTALLKLMAPFDWGKAIQDFHRAGKGLFGTCAGMILLAKKVEPKQVALDCIDCVVARNAYGRQLDSHTATSDFCDAAITPNQKLTCVFIRAPQIISYAKDVQLLVSCENKPVCIRQNNVLISSFHPELTDDTSVHRYFLNAVVNNNSHHTV